MNRYEENAITYHGVSFRYAQGQSIRVGSEIHSYHEILYYRGGDATFLSEHFQETLQSGTLVLIPRETYHQLHIGNQHAYTRLTISFGDLPEARLIETTMREMTVYKQLGMGIRQVLDGMCGVIGAQGASHEEIGMYLYGAFLMLLSQLRMDMPTASEPQLRATDQLLSRAIAYIDAHLSQELSVSALARAMNVSVSALAHCFSSQLGVSAYRYVTEKRLIYANKRLRAGERPTQVYAQCGYKDYPTFYKAYVKMFAHAPSQDVK